jgi:cytochrome c-type biogenesis protein CcmE
MKPKIRRLWGILFCFLSLACATGFILYAFQENLLFFYTPSDLFVKKIHEKQKIRLGGYVKPRSFKYDKKKQKVEFILSDGQYEIYISYRGILPNLFREGQTIIVEGYLINSTHFDAINVLAKHDENYKPPPIKKALYSKGIHIKYNDR